MIFGHFHSTFAFLCAVSKRKSVSIFIPLSGTNITPNKNLNKILQNCCICFSRCELTTGTCIFEILKYISGDLKIKGIIKYGFHSISEIGKCDIYFKTLGISC